MKQRNSVIFISLIALTLSVQGQDEGYIMHYNSPGTDYLDVDAERTTLSDAMSSFLFHLTDYDYIKVTSQDGPDRKTVAPAVDFLFLEGEWLDL